MIQALETSYGGCRFRSRLETRWAVFLDHLQIGWEYEPEGYLVGPHFPEDTEHVDHRRPYLPDFWLPSQRLWVEVKGSSAQMDNTVLVDSSISHQGWGLPASPYDEAFNDQSRNTYRVLVLGPVPKKTASTVVHPLTHFHKGDVYRSWGEFTVTGVRPLSHHTDPIIGNDSPSYDLSVDCVSHRYLHNQAGDPWVRMAYTAARRARFEHGERG